VKRKVLVEVEVPVGMSSGGAVDILREALEEAGERDVTVKAVDPTVGAGSWPTSLIVGLGGDGQLRLCGPFWSDDAAREWHALEVADDDKTPVVIRASAPEQQWRLK
jgi:hypothetical protein